MLGSDANSRSCHWLLSRRLAFRYPSLWTWHSDIDGEEDAPVYLGMYLCVCVWVSFERIPSTSISISRSKIRSKAFIHPSIHSYLVNIVWTMNQLWKQRQLLPDQVSSRSSRKSAAKCTGHAQGLWNLSFCVLSFMHRLYFVAFHCITLSILAPFCLWYWPVWLSSRFGVYTRYSFIRPFVLWFFRTIHNREYMRVSIHRNSGRENKAWK